MEHFNHSIYEEVFMNIKELREKNGKNCIGQVLQVIDNTTLLFSYYCFLHVGDTIAIYEPCDPIKDIDGTVIDHYEFIKDKLEIIDVADRYCVAQKKEYMSKTASFATAISPILEKRELIPLNVDASIIKPITIKNKKIQIGDPVKKISSN